MMALRIVRQPKQIVLLGAPVSAAALKPGHEKAPQALRAAGMIERLQSAGFSVTDGGDEPAEIYQPDEESPRARNLPHIVRFLENFKPRVEAAVKTGGLPVILTGDCSVVLATVAGARRYYRNVSVIYMDRDADLNVPATTPSGCVDGMVISHLTGRGAAELVRFWSEPPLVRDPEVALFGVARLDPPEEKMLSSIPIRYFPAGKIQEMGAEAAAKKAVELVHGDKNEFVLHFDVDVIAREDFEATDLPGEGGLRLAQVREALEFFVKEPKLIAFEIAAYNPEHDADGRGAKLIVELIASALAARLAAQEQASQPPAKAAEPAEASTEQAAEAQNGSAEASSSTEP